MSPRKRAYWIQMCAVGGGAVLLWLLEFLYQYRISVPDDLGTSFVRSFGFAGATLLGLTLFSSAIFKWFPLTARYWRIRRYLGVAGFLLIAGHVGSVYYFFVGFKNILAPYAVLNPIQNPIIFGSLGFFIIFFMAATSTDWAKEKMGAKRWKILHRFVYLAYASIIFHFMTMNPSVLTTPPGIALLIVTACTVFGMIFWYIKTVMRRGWKTMGAWVGLALILGTLVLGYMLYQVQFK